MLGVFIFGLVFSFLWVWCLEIKFLLELVDLFIGIYLVFCLIMVFLWRFLRFVVVVLVVVMFLGVYVIFNSRRNFVCVSVDILFGFDSDLEKFVDCFLFKFFGLRWDLNWDMCDKGERKFKKKDNGRIEEESKDIKFIVVCYFVFIRYG